jgi:hypothetical protein
VTGAEGAAIFVPVPVENVVVAVLDGPVAAVEGQHACGVGASRGVAGDAVDGFGRELAGGLRDGGTLDDEDLADAGKVEVGSFLNLCICSMKAALWDLSRL